MPELPEVENFRFFFNEHALRQVIQKVKITDSGILVNPERAKEIEQFLQGKQFTHTFRHGKYMFAQLSSNKWLMIHFGMSGFLRYRSESAAPHKHDRVLFYFTNHHYLAFNCMRKFGKTDIISTPQNFISERKFGPDALNISLSRFQQILEGRKRSIKSALLTQNVIAGVGNLYADEALYQSRIYPNSKIGDLNSSQINRLHEILVSILQTAVEFQTDYGKFPKNFFIHHRKKDGTCPRCGSTLNRLKIAQRTTYFCPSCQNPKP